MSSQDGNLPTHMTAQGGRSASPGPLAGFYILYAITARDYAIGADSSLSYRIVAPFDMRIEEASFGVQSKTDTPTYRITNDTQSNTIVTSSNFTTGGEVVYWNGSSDGTGTLSNRDIAKGDVLNVLFGSGGTDAFVCGVALITCYVKSHVNASVAED